jgi:uncharacterized protein
MKKVIITIIIVVALLAIVAAINSSISQPKAVIKNHSFDLLLAKTEKEKEIGLSNNKSLPLNQGMLFKFNSASYYSFWMKNMKFPIDIIFMKNNKIVTIYSKVKPPAQSNNQLAIYQPEEPADAVLEINAGLSDKYGFKKDITVNYENLRN